MQMQSVATSRVIILKLAVDIMLIGCSSKVALHYIADHLQDTQRASMQVDEEDDATATQSILRLRPDEVPRVSAGTATEPFQLAPALSIISNTDPLVAAAPVL